MNGTNFILTEVYNFNLIIEQLYGNKDTIYERHRHRYEVNQKYLEQLEKSGLKFVGSSTDGERLEIFELEKHPYYVGVQYHPEYLSRPLNPSPPFLGLILAAKDKLKGYLAKGCKFSPREPQSEYYDSGSEIIDSFLTINNLINLCLI